MQNTLISWTDHTYNPWTGCTKVSPACAHCYAETVSKRNPKVLGQWGPGQPRIRTGEHSVRNVIRWQRQAAREGRRTKVFAASMADWLDDEVPTEWLFDFLQLIFRTPSLDWQLLTKRPENFFPRLNGVLVDFHKTDTTNTSERIRDWLSGERVPHNVWIGVTAEDQYHYDKRAHYLSVIPARIRFLSCEPLLESILLYYPGFQPDWVIVGGESGSKQKARTMNPDHARQLELQCRAYRIPFFFKQWGTHRPVDQLSDDTLDGETHKQFPR